MARRGKAGKRESLGETKYSGFLLGVCTHRKCRVVRRVYAEVIGCSAVHVHGGSMQPGGVLTVSTAARTYDR
jgi:hypothetical protein